MKVGYGLIHAAIIQQEIAQIVMGFCIIGPDGERLKVVSHCLMVVACFSERIGQIEMRRRVIRFYFNCFFKMKQKRFQSEALRMWQLCRPAYH